jgi:hypothetical protein
MNMNTRVRVPHYLVDVLPSVDQELVYERLWRFGPQRYDLANIKVSHATASDVLLIIKDIESLKGCLGLRDALQIREKGPCVFRDLFGLGSILCCLKSVTRLRDKFYAPALWEYGDQLGVFWADLSTWHEDCLVARFPVS